MSIAYANDPTIIAGGASQDTFISAPTSLYVGQANKIVAASVRLPDLVQNSPVVKMRLYRQPTGGQNTQTDERTLDVNSRWQNLFDVTPLYGIACVYGATAVSEDGSESAISNQVPYTAVANPLPLLPAYGITQGAFGPYPLLGSDVYLDPNTGEGVIGPNGDFLTINGLQLLAQDLRNRILTTVGELVLHPTYGFVNGRLIGTGQSDPVGMAQKLRTRIIDCLSAEPRVDSIDDVIISRPTYDGWTISYTVYAIGVEDPLHGNLVYPYFLSSVT